MRCVMERLRATPPEREALIAENEWNAAAAKDMHRRAIAAQEALRIAQEAITKFLDGDYENPRRHRPGQCAHGIWYWQACENCADAHFEAAKNAIDAALTGDQK